MKTNDVIVKQMQELLAEASAEQELARLVEESAADEEKLTVAISQSEPKEDAPEVKSDDVLDTVDSADDVDHVENVDAVENKQPENKKFVAEDVELPTAVSDEKPEEVKPEVESDDVLDTVDSAEDVDHVENVDASETKQPENKEFVAEDVKLPEGILTKKPDESAPEVETDDVREKLDCAEDVDHVENDDASDKKQPEDKDYVTEDVELPEGISDKEPSEDKPEVESDDVLDTVDSADDVDHVENVDAVENKQPENKEFVAEDVKLPEGILTKKLDETKPEVESNDVLDTVDSAEDVEPVKNVDASDTKQPEDKLFEAIDEFNKFIASLSEDVELPTAVSDEKPDESAPEVENDDVREKLDCAEDVEPVKNVDASDTKQPENKEYHSIQDVINLGSEAFKSEKDKKELQERVAILLAGENGDLLYEEYNKLLSEAEAIRARIVRKYSIISENRTNTLIESIQNVENKFKAKKDDMFKKLNEQREINEAKDNAERLSLNDTAFR